jgi:molecular chaperone DnaK (HSP70)
VEARAEHQGARALTDIAPTSSVIGIDLGTTNSALAWAGPRGPVRVFDIPQLVGEGEVGRQPTLPSFLYFPTPFEVTSGVVALPWNPAPDIVAGRFAREHGALVPARQISSAKSWLSNSAVDRSASLLPWVDEAVLRLSPVDASRRLIEHLRSAWNHLHAAGDPARQMECQAIVLTVPASFDEEARELTLQAAADAGLEKVTLLEEPLAALYAWIAAHPRLPMTTLGEGTLVLVCDVGGGTTDFSLIRAAIEDGELVFERIAIGEHLLLGGDNLDLALAVAVEEKLPAGGARLSLSQRLTLRRKCSAAKEQLLSENGPSDVSITIPGGGSSLVGGGVTADLSRDAVSRALLEGFLPLTAADDLPARSRRGGLRELGLPYETEPAITRHLAAFLTRAGEGGEPMARPDAVLFNGGFFAPGVARERVLEALARWSGKRPLLLENERPEASVAIGAAFYARLRGDPGRARNLLIRAGSARAYYIGVAGSGDGASAVCVMPRGTQEGTRASLDRDFTVIANQPSAFTLYSTMTRADPLNAVVTFSEEDDDVHRHAPLVTALRFGKRSRRVPLAVRLTASFTETGTLELWCESTTTEHRWRLSFSLRSAGSNPLDDADEDEEEDNEGTDGIRTADHVVIADDALHAGKALIRGVFGEDEGDVAPGGLVGALENALGHGKHAWPLPVLRSLADALIDVAEGRRRGPSYEVRWLNLAGFCTRPGFGAPTDPWRISELRKVYLSGLVFPKDVQAQVEWLVLWQRVAAGFTTGQQKELAQRVIGQLGIGQKKPVRINAQIDREAWRLLGTLERIDAGQRVRLGDELVIRTVREPRNAARAWALGRMGARNPLYGPLNTVVPASAAERWIGRLLELKSITPDVAAVVVQLGALTGDPARDVSMDVRQRAAQMLSSAGVSADALAPLERVVPVSRAAAGRAFGEPLPEGLRLESD